MKSYLLFIFVILILFLDDNILALLGYPHYDVKADPIFKVHPVSYLSILVVVFFFLVRKLKLTDIIKSCRRESELIALCLFLFLYLIVTGRLSSISFIIDALLTPALISILFYHTSEKIMIRQKWLLYAAFVLNTLLAIYEKISSKTILSSFYISRSGFRATALYGHPLNNALIMSILGIILYFSFAKLTNKIVVLILTMLSLFCFGARGGIIGIFCGVVLGILFDFFSKRIKQSLRTVFAAIVVFAASLFVLLNTSLGDRVLSKLSLSNDDSALERVKSLNLLNIMDANQLQWGMSDSDTELLMRRGGVHIIENYFVVWITKFGLYISILLLLILIFFIIKQLRRFDKVNMFPILVTVLFVASINNSLASKTRAISILVLCCYMLKKEKHVLLDIHNNLNSI